MLIVNFKLVDRKKKKRFKRVNVHFSIIQILLQSSLFVWISERNYIVNLILYFSVMNLLIQELKGFHYLGNLLLQ